jgi:tRNA dimethylallyltransferase
MARHGFEPHNIASSEPGARWFLDRKPMKPFSVLLMGPTASGKSALAMALCERFPLEIVSVDSAQVYRGMDIGTAKPDAATQARVPHHLLDLIDPDQAYSAARFHDDAVAAIAAIHARGRIPMLVGGTMLYFKALREGLSRLPRSDAAVRAAIDAQAEREGWPAVHAALAEVDPVIAARLKPTDRQRIQRALEVYRVSGTPLSMLQGSRAPALDGDLLAIALMPADRAELHRRIAVRFATMLDQGLIDEVVGLRRRYRLTAAMSSMRSIGYRQAWDTLEGTEPAATLLARGIAATRQLAKRQLTWLRAMDVTPIDCLSEHPERLAARLIETYAAR